MELIKKPYLEQLEMWPQSGRHIMAQYDSESVIVYQAYRPEIGHYAAKYGHFGGAFSYSRMSWIKPNFLWMMYRSGWATKEGQEVILAIRLKRRFFDEILSLAVSSSYNSRDFSSQEDWKKAVTDSDVRLQWDPDHAPDGRTVERRAIQLGLRGDVLARYGKDEILSIEDVSAFVEEQRSTLESLSKLVVPLEMPYIPQDEALQDHLKLESIIS